MAITMAVSIVNIEIGNLNVLKLNFAFWSQEKGDNGSYCGQSKNKSDCD